MTAVSEVLREATVALIDSGVATRYSVAKDSGVGYDTLVRWLDEGRDIRASTIDALAAYLGLELLPAKDKPTAKVVKASMKIKTVNNPTGRSN